MKELTTSDIMFDVIDVAALNALVRSANSLLADSTAIEDIWPWLLQMVPSERRGLRPRLRLTSLDRIGSEQGRSGATVWLGTFLPADDASASRVRSSPLVIKLRHAQPHRRPLLDEFERARKARAYLGDPSSFALPLHLDKPARGLPYEVLWSPFSSATTFWGQGLHHADLFGVLRANDDAEAGELLDHTLGALEAMHDRKGDGPIVRRVGYASEYGAYLRGMLDEAEPWWSRWSTEWGGVDKRKATDLDRTFTNPLWMASKLLPLERPLHLATVHGDLHPRNIVKTHDGRCRVIDFGWAGVEKHIAKDFVLLECNLRALALDADIGLDALDRLNDLLAGGAPRASTHAVDQRVRLVARLRQVASERLHCDPASDDWWFEYEVPLFLVALGLLKHIRDADNQLALRHLVLTLASAIAARKLPTVRRGR